MAYVIFTSNSPAPFNVDTEVPLALDWLRYLERCRSSWRKPPPFEIREADGKLIGVFKHDTIIAIIEGAGVPGGGSHDRNE